MASEHPSEATVVTLGDAADTPRATDAEASLDPSSADAVVALDTAGVDRARRTDPSLPVVALVVDSTDAHADDPVVDAVATDPDAAETQARWLASRPDEQVRSTPSQEPSRIEQLQAGTTRLATVRSTEEAYRTTVAVADEVFAEYDALIGVLEDGWIEPVAVSPGVEIEACNRVRVGRGSAGTAIERGEPVVTPSDGGETDPSLTVPVADDAVLQVVTDPGDDFADADGRLAGLLASHLEETLERLRADEELRSERDRLLALFENVPDPAVAYDYVDGRPVFRRVNSAFEETFGYDAATVAGESIDEYIVPDDDDARSAASDLNDRLHRGENVRQEVTRLTADGERHFILHVVPIHLDAENESGYAIYTDVTDSRNREATLRRQNERLDEFASIVSHDLRSPLSVAKGYVDLARDTGDTDHLDRADDALDRMDDLVGDLLSLAREGDVVGDRETVSLEAIAREAWNGVETADATLVVDDDDVFDASPNRTRELFENLFHNSVEHGSTGSRAEPDDGVEHGSTGGQTDSGVTVRVGTAEFRSDGGRGFYIEDDGPGLPETDADRLFETGYTTGDDGTGLGLAIAERIADAHGWTVHATTARTGGARFEFRTD